MILGDLGVEERVPRGGERPLENIEPLDPRQTLTNTNETLF